MYRASPLRTPKDTQVQSPVLESLNFNSPNLPVSHFKPPGNIANYLANTHWAADISKMAHGLNSYFELTLKLFGVSILGWIVGMAVYLPAFWLGTDTDVSDYVSTIVRSSFPFTFSFYLIIFLPSIGLIPRVAPSFRNLWGRITLGLIIGLFCGLSWAREPMAFSRVYGTIPLTFAFAAMGIAYGWGISRALGDHLPRHREPTAGRPESPTSIGF